eukprot:5595743-Pleurochrysis_carterae.AAC.1
MGRNGYPGNPVDSGVSPAREYFIRTILGTTCHDGHAIGRHKQFECACGVIPWGMREVLRGEGSCARAVTVLYRPPGLESRPSAAKASLPSP